MYLALLFLEKTASYALYISFILDSVINITEHRNQSIDLFCSQCTGFFMIRISVMIKLMPQKNNTAFFNINHSLDAILYLEQLQPGAQFIVGTPSKYIKLYSNLTLIALTLYMKFVQTYPKGLKMDATDFTPPKKIFVYCFSVVLVRF